MAEITQRRFRRSARRPGPASWTAGERWRRAAATWTRPSAWLRENGKISAAKRQDRERSEGAVAVVVHGGAQPVGAIATLECETDFVAKSPEFVSLVEEIADELAVNGEEALAGYAGADRESRAGLEGEHRPRPDGALRGARAARHRQLPAPPERPRRERRARRALRRRRVARARHRRPHRVRSSGVPPPRGRARRSTSRTSARRRTRSPATRASRRPPSTRSSRAGFRAGTRSGSSSTSPTSGTRSRPSGSCSATQSSIRFAQAVVGS